MMRKLFTLLLLCIVLSLNAAEKVWCIVADSGQKIAMSNVSFMLASDASESLSIVCNNGIVIYNVAKITFEIAEPTGISDITDDSGEASFKVLPASSSLQIMGCAEGSKIFVYDSGGKIVRQSIVTSSDHEVSLIGLPLGIYILRLGNNSIKFIKK